MKALFLSFAILGAALAAASADTMPKIGSEKLCKARSAGEKMMHLAELESVADCVREENQAKDRQNDIENSLAPPCVKSLFNFQQGRIRCANAAFGLRNRRLMPMHEPPWFSLAGIRARFQVLRG